MRCGAPLGLAAILMTLEEVAGAALFWAATEPLTVTIATVSSPIAAMRFSAAAKLLLRRFIADSLRPSVERSTPARKTLMPLSSVLPSPSA